MVQAVYIQKARGIYAKAHIKMQEGTKDSIKVYNVDEVAHPNTGEPYWRFALAGSPTSLKEIYAMTGDHYQPSKKLKAFAARM